MMRGRRARPGVTSAQATLLGTLLCGVLDIAAAFALSWVRAGRTPLDVLKGIASALFGSAALSGGAPMVAAGFVMHFSVAFTATAVFYGLSRRLRILRTAPLLLVGPLYGAVVFAAMYYGTLPLMSLLRSWSLGTAPRLTGGMSWPLLLIHLAGVGPPIVWSIRRIREP